MGGWVFRKKLKGAGEYCTGTPAHLRTKWLMHSTDMDTSRRVRQLGVTLRLDY